MLTHLEAAWENRTYVRKALRLGAKKMCTLVEQFNSPRLNISNIVYGRRTNEHGRVEYLKDPNARAHLGYAIPEKVVLSRWRQRTHEQYHFGGMRLSPNIWRSINLALGSDYFAMMQMNDEEIDARYSITEVLLRDWNYPTVIGLNVVRLMEGLGFEKFQALMQRHNDPNRDEHYGTPDLFLWALRNDTGKIEYTRFVEVKKPDEPLSQDQKDELCFLKHQLHLKARYLRLRERRSVHLNLPVSPNLQML